MVLQAGVSKPVTIDADALKAFMADAKQRVAIINSMTSRFSRDAATQFGASFNALDWQRDFGARLMDRPVNVLSAVATAPNLGMAQAELFSAKRNVAIKHADDDDLSLNIITPCRIVHMRLDGGGQFGPTYRLWYASNTPAIIAGQGGNASGCGTFPNADVFLVYVTAVPPSSHVAPDFLTLQHASTPAVPTSATMNFYNQNIANFAIPQCNGCDGSTVGGFVAYASGFTHVVIDLVGYAARSANTAALNCVNATPNTTYSNNGTSSSTAGIVNSINVPACPASYTLTSVIANFDVDANDVTGSCTSSACQIFTGHAHLGASIGARCCRIPSGI